MSSAPQKALRSGRAKVNSEGASLPGTLKKTKRTPSITCSSLGLCTSSVGGRMPTRPNGTALPRPLSTTPVAWAGRRLPYMYMARRAMAVPISTFSLVASSMKPGSA